MTRYRMGAARAAALVVAALALVFAAGQIAWGSLEIPLATVGEEPLVERQRQLEELEKRSGGDPYVLEELGRIAYQRANLPLARQLWDKAAQQQPNIPRAAVQLVFASIAAGRLEEAQRQLEALDVASMNDAHVVIAAGELALVRNDLKGANEFLARALDLAPQYAATHLTLGHFSEVSGDYSAAQASYEKATELEPDRAAGWLRLAALHFRLNRPEEALAAFRKAEACRGIQPLAETRMGEAYYLNNDLFNAYKQFTAAVARDKKDPFPHLRVAQIFDRTDHADQAQAEIEQILASQEYPEALKVAAEVELKRDRLDQAIEYYRRALKANPEDWVIANNLAILLVQTGGSGGEAMQYVDRAVRGAGPQAPALQGTRGCALWLAERFDEAEPVLKQAIAATPNYPWTRYCYGNVLLELDRPVEAREQFEACQFLDPAFPRHDEVSKRLAKLNDAQ